MKGLFYQRVRQMTRCSRYALIIALLVPLSPMAVWANHGACGSTDLSVDNGNSVEYVIKGSRTADFEVTDTGNSLVATIEPQRIIGERLGKFAITGVGDGTTTLKISWRRPEGTITCPVSVTVSE
jgi:hypothetical protein